MRNVAENAVFSLKKLIYGGNIFDFDSTSVLICRSRAEQNAIINFLNILALFRIQDSDGGFFEKFGSLLRQKSMKIEERVSPLAPLHEDQFPPELSLRTIEEQANDSGTETLQDTDSEPDDPQAKTVEMIEDCTGWNVSVLSNF